MLYGLGFLSFLRLRFSALAAALSFLVGVFERPEKINSFGGGGFGGGFNLFS